MILMSLSFMFKMMDMVGIGTDDPSDTLDVKTGGHISGTEAFK